MCCFVCCCMCAGAAGKLQCLQLLLACLGPSCPGPLLERLTATLLTWTQPQAWFNPPAAQQQQQGGKSATGTTAAAAAEADGAPGAASEAQQEARAQLAAALACCLRVQLFRFAAPESGVGTAAPVSSTSASCEPSLSRWLICTM